MTSRRLHHARLIGLLLMLGWPWIGCAQQVRAADETPAQAWYDYYRQRAASDYQLVWSADKKPLTIVRKEILNWINPLEDGKINGSTFVWEHDGRPIAIGQFFSYLIGDDKRSFCHVFSTLSDEPLVGRRRGEIFWKPALSGESAWRIDSDAPAPAASRAGRLIQMKTLARRFSAYTEEARRGKRNLRFLPRPLYRYSEATKDVDGGIFAYVVGNDPELFILVEGGLKAGDSAWRYRFAQSTRSTTVALENETEVYRYDAAGGDPAAPTAIYLSKHGVETIPSRLATDASP